MDPLDRARVRAGADRHRLDDRTRGGGRPVAGGAAARRSATRSRSSRWRTAGSTCSRHSIRPTSCCRRTSTACRRSSRARPRGQALRARRVRREGILAAQVAAAERLRAAGERASACCSSSGRSGAAMARSPRITLAPGSRFLVNGEPTDSKLATGTRGILRVRLHARGRAGHSSAPRAVRIGDREAGRRAGAAARAAAAVRSRLRRDLLQRRADRAAAWRPTWFPRRRRPR